MFSGEIPNLYDVGFIRGDLDCISSAYINWQSEFRDIAPIKPVRYKNVADFSFLNNSNNKRECQVFIKTKSDWLLYMQSGRSDSDPFPAMSYLAKICKTNSIRACSTRPDVKYQGTVFEYYGPDGDALGYKRSIYAVNDGGKWSFGESGEPLQWENMDNYSKKATKNRFNRDKLREILLGFKIHAFDDEFYRTDSVFLGLMVCNIDA